MAERFHHPFSPSKLQPLEVSPLYEGETGDTEASTAGTKQHDFAERDVIDIDDPALLDSEMAAVLSCRVYRDKVLQNYAEPPTILKEEYLPIDDEVIIGPGEHGPETRWAGTTAGYADLCIISKCVTFADILDWKFGLWSVEPTENNLQGIAYLLGLFFRYPTLNKITVHFVLPHRDEIDHHTFHREQFQALYLRVKSVVARAVEARTMLRERKMENCRVTTASCLWCARKGRCETLAGLVLKVGKKYSPVAIPDDLTPSAIHDAASSTQLMELSTLMEAWSKAVKKQICEYAIDNTDWMPEQYKLVERSDTKILDYKAVEKSALACGVSQEQLDAMKKIPMTELHKVIMDLQPRGEKEAAVTAFKEDLLASGASEKEPAIYFLQRLKT